MRQTNVTKEQVYRAMMARETSANVGQTCPHLRDYATIEDYVEAHVAWELRCHNANVAFNTAIAVILNTLIEEMGLSVKAARGG